MLKRIMKEYKEAGYCVWHCPRLHQVSLNGGKCMTEREAIKEMKVHLKMRAIELNVIKLRNDDTLSKMNSLGLS